MKYLKSKYIFIVLTAVCIAFIWYHSGLDGYESSLESQEVLSVINNILAFFGIPSDVSEFVLRKAAHFLEFSGLGFLLTMDVYLWSKNMFKNIYISPFIGILSACIDETIQIYSPGRSSKIADVWVDFAGVLAATIVTLILIYTFIDKKISASD